MQILKTVGKTLAITAAILMLAVPVMAGNGNGGKGINSGQGTGTRTQDRSRLKDGSCTKNIETNSDVQLLVHNGKGAGDSTGPLNTCVCIHPELCDCDAA
jgi:hypothetical protein